MIFVYGIAVFFVMWWIVLFAILPWGVKTAQEAGEPGVAGQATSAPQDPMLRRKVLWTTIVTCILFTLFMANHEYGWLTIDDLPGPSARNLAVTSPKG